MDDILSTNVGYPQKLDALNSIMDCHELSVSPDLPVFSKFIIAYVSHVFISCSIFLIFLFTCPF